jgi:putative membrane protein
VNLLAQIFIVLAVLCHVGIFALESLSFRHSRVQAIFGVPAQSSATVRVWAMNQGFYNLFLAAGPAAGLVLHYAGEGAAGRALAIYGCAFMAACGVVLLGTSRRLWRGAALQSGPPLVALIALALSA